ncbi:MAG TPA: RIP metalloprotease RseP [Cytophagales bacterium]|nr:RIP metalloprotease RseP [Cytophagales bacterium]
MDILSIVVMVAQVLLGLSILVGLHELGHLLTAKMFGMRVEKYSIGFPPKVVGFQYGETEYSIGAIPLGGFVKISGMIDESMDTEHLSKEPQPWEFRAKPAWQRLIVMMGGIIVNVILGILIFIVMFYAYGEQYYKTSEVNKHGIVPSELGSEIGLKVGDKIVEINGKPYESFSDIYSPKVILQNGSYYTVDRNGELLTIKIPSDFIDKFSDKKAGGGPFVMPRSTFTIGKLSPGHPAEENGLKPGDRILEIDGQKVTFYDQFQSLIKSKKDQTIDVKLERDGKILSKSIKLGKDGVIGVYPNLDIDPSTKKYTFAEAIPYGTKKAFNVVWINIQAFGKIFRGEISASKSLSGPVGIAKLFGGTWDWENFWYLVGLLSMVLAFMNFMPIPALDGGHVMFLTYEIVSGRKPSDKFLENSTKIGMVFLLALMAFAIFNDIFKEVF